MEGTIIQIIGPVIDVAFGVESLPEIYEALEVPEADLILEVQQLLGDGVVRTIAMGSTDGLKRGLRVNSTGSPIQVPVGQATLGRILDVLGKPVDEKGEVPAQHKRSIHQDAPSFEELAWKPASRLLT